MLCILGAGSLARSLPKLTDQKWAAVLHEQLEHVPWEGFRFYDLVFPLFVFLVGVSTAFSLDRIVEREGKGAAYDRVVRRGIILYLLGIFYHGGIGDPEQFRFLGVLQRIAICYVAGSVLYLNLRWRGLLVASAVLLIGYWALMSFVPVPGHGAANWNEGTNLANYLDSQYLPGYKWDGDWDPEGLAEYVASDCQWPAGDLCRATVAEPTARQRQTTRHTYLDWRGLYRSGLRLAHRTDP